MKLSLSSKFLRHDSRLLGELKLQGALLTSLATVLLFGASNIGCAKVEPEPTYQVARRQVPPEKPYGRKTWHHDPHGVPVASNSEAPQLEPGASAPRSAKSVREATAALGAMLGYKSECSGAVCDTPVDIVLGSESGPIASAIERQSRARTTIDHRAQIVHVEEAPARKSTRSSRAKNQAVLQPEVLPNDGALADSVENDFRGAVQEADETVPMLPPAEVGSLTRPSN